MLLKKRTSIGGNFLRKGEDFVVDDILTIKDEGKKVQGEYGEQNIFVVSIGQKEGQVSFNQTTINNLVDSYGEESKEWIDKKVKVWGIMQNVQGKMRKVYYFLHPDTILDEKTGEFVIGENTQNDEVPIIEDENATQ